MSVHNGSITILEIRPSGNVSLRQVGEAGHFPPQLLTFNQICIYIFTERMLTCLLSPVSQTLRRTCTQSTRNISLTFNLAQLEKPSEQQKETEPEEKNSLSRRDYRYIFPEFLPDPKPEWRNHIREKLERRDMLNRREQIEIPGINLSFLFT